MSLLRSPSTPGSNMCKAVIAGFIRCALCALLFLAGSDALHHCRYEPEGPFSRSSSIPEWHVQGWYCFFCTSRCILSCGRQARMFGISAGMEQKDSYAACSRPRSLPTSAAARAWLVFLVTIFHAVLHSVVDMLKMLGILVGTDQKDSSSLVVFSAMARAGLVYWLRCTPRCVPLIVGFRR